MYRATPADDKPKRRLPVPIHSGVNSDSLSGRVKAFVQRKITAQEMGQHLGKAEFSAVSKDSTTVSEQVSPDPPEAQDEVFGVGGADLNQNNGCSGKDPAPDSAPQHDLTDPRPHLVRLFSRDAPGREDNTFKERPSESDELQTIPEEARPEAEQ